MADLRIKAEIIGLDKELEKETKRIEKQVPKALQFVGAELKSDLQQTLQREWYEKYTPTEYSRRTNNPEWGTPIGADEHFGDLVKGKELYFEFEPTWFHRLEEPWSFTSDEGIEWIQHKHIYPKRTIPARPFWNIFLNDQAHGGLIDKFIRGMSPFEVFAESQDSNIDLTEFELPAD